ncbi:putative baseplate assembly protein [Mesorhizobium sp. L-8-3]|uniref:putative baseplate assembly protein n=1 Tax=Mesorhizobium sp. L-8-3 TaxID=2744522 RepID=UPI0019271D5F|nr:putative baseplate assembly protein [Mesorhizobium sp. L-8-3]BCH26315.1 putative baseplate assembly protein [Mesorhizobium sp. L-8-3]
MVVLSSDGLVLCEDERRSGVLRDPAHPLNGIDFIEYRRDLLALPGRQHVLDVVFLKPAPVPPAVTAANFSVLGGIRIVDIRVLDVEPDPGDPLTLRVFVDREGDFSAYVLDMDHAAIDVERSQAQFGFKASCPSDLDCRPTHDCPPTVLEEPALDYLAKDYQSFRRLMTDLIAERNPNWLERLPADLGMTLVELMAYAGDYLSYYQDAGPGTEGFLDTCLHRISAARHARLIDYTMRNGRNAATFVHFVAVAGSNAVVPRSTRLVSRIGVPLVGEAGAPGPVIPVTADFDSDPALSEATVFETMAPVRVIDTNNEIRIHSWADAQCCLAKGATSAFLYAVTAGGIAIPPDLVAGEYLLLEEVRSPVTGSLPDADPRHRQVVLVEEVELTEDAAFTNALPGGTLTPRLNVADPALPLLHVTWAQDDALVFPLCVSALTDQDVPVDPVTVARGNTVPADHGRTVERDTSLGTLTLPDSGAGRWPLPSLALRDAPLTQAADGPAVRLSLEFAGIPGAESWTPVPNLLDSGPFDQHFVAEIDNAGDAVLRFGDDRYGRRPLGAQRAMARYRIGNGAAGNCGWGTLVHAVADGPAAAAIERVRQPLPARFGEDPETIEQVRQIAPEAFRAVQFRAVTERDWEEVALRHPAVAAAKASFHWTGSWYTVFVAIHPVDEADLRRLPGGGAELQPAFAAAVKSHLTRFKLAGYDLNIRAAIYVPLEIDIRLCVGTGHFRGDVLGEALRVLSNRSFADGSRGFFHPLNFGFGGAVYLSRLYAAVEAIEGVNSAEVMLFKRFWELPQAELDRGLIEIGPFEIARLDNDRNFPENGVLRLSAVGGL